MTDLATELEFAREVALLGGRIALEHYRRDLRRERKDDGTWATEADWAVEAQIRLRIARTFPRHNVHGEEEGLTAAGGGPPNPGAPTWVIDPIDGTNNYMAGIALWGTLVGLRVDDESVLGVCHLPALEETYDAATGLGARLNGLPIGVDPTDNLGEATVLFPGLESFHERGLAGFLDELTGRCWRTRGFGDCWGHMLVARGAAHVMVDPVLNLWDFVALEPIVREAGGRITRLDGRPLADGGSCVTTNGSLHDEVVSLARATMPEWAEV